MEYRLTLAKSLEEIIQAQKLRTNAFNLDSLDNDKFDKYCDHLLLYENNTLIATLRMRQSKYSKCPLYSSEEFILPKKFKKKTPNILEVGRLCTSQKRLIAPFALFLGEIEYSKARNIDTILGCTSFETQDPEEASKIFYHFQKKGYTIPRKELIQTINKYKIEFNPKPTNEKLEIPSLAEIYFKCGAKIISTPALDKEFKLTDYLMIGNINQISETIETMLSKVKSKLTIEEEIFQQTFIPIWKQEKINSLTELSHKIKQKPKKRQEKYLENKYKISA